MVANVFVSSNQHQKLGVMVARRGYQETAENGDRFLVLLNGRRYEGAPGTAEYRVYEFERYAMRVEIGEARARAPTTKTTPTDGSPARIRHRAIWRSFRGASACR